MVVWRCVGAVGKKTVYRARRAASTAIKVPVIPVIDCGDLVPENDKKLSKDTFPVVTEIAAACREWGFFQAINAPIERDLIDRFYAQKRAFFSMEREKKETVRRTRENSKGWYDDELTKK